jgi:hypothetical protein
VAFDHAPRCRVTMPVLTLVVLTHVVDDTVNDVNRKTPCSIRKTCSTPRARR